MRKLKDYERPDWLNDVIVIAGNWEPLAHRRRAVLSCVNDVQRYEAEHSEQMVERLVEAGVTVAVWHCFKGFGFEQEKEDMEKTKKFGQLCHKHNIKLGTYINFGSVYAETFFDETPEAKNWIAIDAQGQPHLYSEYFRCYYRQRPCMSKRDYIDYIKKMTLYAVHHCGSDWIHFDNNAQMSCYCEDCRSLFRKFISQRHHNDIETRFGHKQLAHIELPHGTARLGIDTLSSLHEPVLQEWVRFRSKQLDDAVGEVSAAVAEENPDIAIGANPAFDSGEFTPLLWGCDVELLAQNTDLLFSEDGNYPRITDDGRLIGHLFTFKLGQAMGISVPVHQPGATVHPISWAHMKLSLMEAAVFNRGNLGHVYHASDLLDGLSASDTRVETVRFIRANAEYFTRTKTVAEIALLRSSHSMINNWRDALQSKILMEQVLARYGFQFDIVTEEQLGDLSKYRTLVLPNSISLSDEHLRSISSFISSGGSIVATEDSAICDGWGRNRVPADMQRLFGNRERAVGLSGEHCTRKELLCQILDIKSCDTKRVFYIPHLERTGRFVNDFSDTWVAFIDNKYWELPGNAGDIAESITKALGCKQIVSMKKSGFVVPQLAAVSGTNDFVLHLLNYKIEQYVDKLNICLNLRDVTNISKVKTLSMEYPQAKAIEYKINYSGLSLAVPAFKVYRVILIEKAG